MKHVGYFMLGIAAIPMMTVALPFLLFWAMGRYLINCLEAPRRDQEFEDALNKAIFREKI